MTIVPFLQRVSNVILNPIILLLFAVSFLYFVYGVVKFLQQEADGKGTEREEAKNSIKWGIVGMVIMFSVYGLINFVLASFGIQPTSKVNGSDVNIPTYITQPTQ